VSQSRIHADLSNASYRLTCVRCVTLSQGHEFKLKYSTCLCELVLDGHDPRNVSIKHRGVM